MTVCISVLGKEEDVVIVGSDRMITDNAIPIEYESDETKFTTYGGEMPYFVFSSAGSALLPSAVKEDLERQLDSVETVKQAALCVKDAFIEIKKERFEELMLEPRGISLNGFYSTNLFNTERGQEWDRALSNYSINLDIIIAGVDERGIHSYRVSDPNNGGIASYLESLENVGFDSIGSGASLARDTLTGRYKVDGTKGELSYVTYTALRNASQAPGVGEKFDMCSISEDGIEIIEEWEKLRNLYEENEGISSPPDLFEDTAEE